MSVEKHLANARKFFSQSRIADAIYEYSRTHPRANFPYPLAEREAFKLAVEKHMAYCYLPYYWAI